MIRKTKICEDCGEKTTYWNIHHKDHNHSNNDPLNLIILCKSCHGKIHGNDPYRDEAVNIRDSYNMMVNNHRYSTRLKDGFELIEDNY